MPELFNYSFISGALQLCAKSHILRLPSLESVKPEMIND